MENPAQKKHSPSNEWYELSWILDNLRASPAIYLIEEIIEDGRKEYCAADVHRWGRDVECGGVYGKIRDLVRVRVFEAVEGEKLDRGLVAGILVPFEEEKRVDEGKNLVGLDEIEGRLNKLMEEIGVSTKGAGVNEGTTNT